MLALLLRVGEAQAITRYGLLPYLLVTAITIGAFAATGLYGAVVRFIDQCLLIAAGIGLALAIAPIYLLSSYFNYLKIPHNALMIYWFVAFSHVVMSRMTARALLRDSQFEKRKRMGPLVAVYGAGEAGVKLARAIRVSDKYRLACFFDDKSVLKNRNVAGLRVFSPDLVVDVVAHHHIDLIIIAIPSATPEQRKAIIANAQKSGAQVKTLYNLMELADEHITTRSIRDLKVDDLLGREPIQPDMHLFKKCVHHQNILVTGAGGSIGSELCRQVLTLDPLSLHLIDHCEYALYNIQQQLRDRFPRAVVHAHLGSVCDARLVDRVVADNKIDTIYHAAAYKHVPLVEGNMAEGLRNNILGAEIVANAAQRFKVKTCVLVSTDKAVRPTSIMGASKRIAELIFQAAAVKQSGTKFCAVRFGNVLGSSGSVVPLFKQQIERGGPITITHRDVVRYFMSIPEAAQLVVQAGAMATGGDVFVMDMGSPVKIVDLARTMIAMCGLTEKCPENPSGDIEIQFIGLRPGEKLFEELFAGNDAIPSRHPRIMTTTEYVIEPDVLSQQVAYLMVACATNDTSMLKILVRKLVHGYARDATKEAALVPGQADDTETLPTLPFMPIRMMGRTGLRH
ncbi:NDP-sugar epimerase, includes UDP-GlcNAc-inverting 4,6-dehydratase FlaA1 and capsular polysaccharide biosynthesis protein EpsC [Noviherbaspirillum humi]|uniref:NDP-sugar epimerase, includes UDP-GlcNAc-inverting 4,6-dehydratase FlaA1 and capsular polysaccharide biosynthesis protein EpsC n=2 Tax=Noviherbaspirillum humi TaxID=1688639 RepID=A0A239GBG8_9BURK|nr:NDP-sugar epimerase, includes UDP-GlcNAc-inverting 4,6-dehydratase FlaA1 and capsular polysaccharide biosynthesis protein EpsC [Noviherbaspirillum humi]